MLRVDLTWIVHSILVLLNMCQSSFNDASEMRSSTHFSSVTATLFSLNAKHISSNLRTISFQTGPSLILSSFLPSINSQCKRGEFSI